MKIGEQVKYLNGLITVKKRRSDYIAFITDDPVVWECGNSKVIALGELVITMSRVYIPQLQKDN